MRTSSIPSSSRPLRLPASAAALLALVLPAGCGTQLTPDVAQLSGRAVEIVEAGSGDATVVFEAGFGSDWSTWDRVALEVGGRARVFAYSRPGYGRSDPTTVPRDPEHIVEDLRALLAARGYAPPYVLVGHSFGGTYMELFAKQHPGEVTALVLVEPRHRDFSTACEAAGLAGCTIPAATVASLPPVEIAEYEGFDTAAQQIAAAGPFGAYPVRVLTATAHGFAEQVEALWVSMLGELARETIHGEQIVFPDADHFLPTHHPTEVAAVILGLLAAPAAQ